MLKLYNSLTKKLEEFKPINKDVVKMYHCGPTVYSYAHIGNMRAYSFVDLLRRTLKYNGYTLDGLMNITDVGHLTSDEDEGDDKIIVASEREKKSPWEIADYYTEFFFTQAQKLNLDLPAKVIRATSVIEEIIEMVQTLINNGYAYETSKGVYYNVEKFAGYGNLSGVKPEDKLAGARIEVDEEKLNPADFALWIKASKDHIMQWKSPWGMGYPGWHIECSAIGINYLGTQIDVHTGGVDHLTVHHENEIAQNFGFCQKDVVKTWMHVEFLQIDGGKMSKSLGNFYTIDDLERKGYKPMPFKYLCLNTHYSKKLNFTFDALEGSSTALQRLYETALTHKNGTNKISLDVLNEYKVKFLEAINNNLNAPLALSVMWDMVKNQPKSKQVYEIILNFDKVLGLNIEPEVDKLEKEVIAEEVIEIPAAVKQLAEKRWQAKIQRNWTLADELRSQITALGFKITDNKDISYSIERI